MQSLAERVTEVLFILKHITEEMLLQELHCSSHFWQTGAQVAGNSERVTPGSIYPKIKFRSKNPLTSIDWRKLPAGNSVMP